MKRRSLVLLALGLFVVWLARNPAAGLVLVSLLVVGVVVIVRRRSWRRYATLRTGSWHACKREQCRRPIANTSRAGYCSSECRQLARLEREAPWSDQAESRLARLNRRIALARSKPEPDEIPF